MADLEIGGLVKRWNREYWTGVRFSFDPGEGTFRIQVDNDPGAPGQSYDITRSEAMKVVDWIIDTHVFGFE